MHSLLKLVLCGLLALQAYPKAQAQGSPVRPLLALAGERPAPSGRPPAAVAAAAPAVTMLLVGRVEIVNSNVVGAVVEVAGRPDLIAVTNSLGEFQLRVPTGAAVRLTASYSGFADETSTVPAGTRYAVLRLTTPHDIPTPRGSRLKDYLKIGRREGRRELRAIRRN